MTRLRRLTPDPGPLDEAGLVVACAPDDRAVPCLRVNVIAAADGAMTVDGRSGGLGNANDQAMMARLRMHADVVLVGAGTIRVEGYGPLVLPEAAQRWRTDRGMPPNPRLAVASRSGDVPDRVRSPELIMLGEGATARDDLAALGLTQVLCEGGPHLFGSLAAAGQVDEVFLTLSPLLAGPGAGRIVAGSPFAPQRLVLRHLLTDDELLYLRYARAAE